MDRQMAAEAYKDIITTLISPPSQYVYWCRDVCSRGSLYDLRQLHYWNLSYRKPNGLFKGIYASFDFFIVL